ncbi:MAG: ATP-dependent helicase [Gammaproteobacteria bacterium]|nr:ATP-dependent helicase [Gammaproteobacteria bacterium]
MKLTKPQQQAIRYSGRNLQLIACAGSGKTEVVARRVAHLLTRRRARLKPENIIAFTFTNKAAAELKERILARTKDALGEMPIGAAEMYVGTIHGFCQELLKSEVPKYLKHEPLDAIRQKLYVDRNSKKTGLTECKAANGRPLRRYVDTERYTAALSALREDDIQRRYLRDCSVAKVGLPLYCAQTDDDGYLDFSGLLDLAAQELDKNADLRKRLAKRIKYVIVDEYQDVNPVQERLIKHLHDLGAGLCVVGDDDQTIYQWRGSAVDNILTFEDRYPDVQQIRLQDNFRSSVGVIETASRFVGSIDDRLPKSMTFGGSQELEKGDIVALSFDTPAQEASYIADTIKSLRGIRFTDRGESRGLAWSDMAILLRSVRNNGSIIAEALAKAGIPFVVAGIANLFEAPEADAARLLFHYISGHPIGHGKNKRNAPERDSVRNAWKSSSLGTPARKLADALTYAEGIRDGVAQESDGLPSIQAVFLRFLELIQLREENVADSRGQAALFNLGRFSEAITDWETVHFADQTWSSFHGFAAFLYYDGDDTYGEGSQDTAYVTPDAVQITTVHQAKGREWPVVFLPALLRNRFPSQLRKSGLWQVVPRKAFENADRYDASESDERRLFYVAMTRSMKFLHMTWAPVPTNQLYKRKSKFWDECLRLSMSRGECRATKVDHV